MLMLCIGPHGELLPSQKFWNYYKVVDKQVKVPIEETEKETGSKRRKRLLLQHEKKAVVPMKDPNTVSWLACFSFLDLYYTSKRGYWTEEQIDQLKKKVRAFQVLLQVTIIFFKFFPQNSVYLISYPI